MLFVEIFKPLRIWYFRSNILQAEGFSYQLFQLN